MSWLYTIALYLRPYYMAISHWSKPTHTPGGHHSLTPKRMNDEAPYGMWKEIRLKFVTWVQISNEHKGEGAITKTSLKANIGVCLLIP